MSDKETLYARWIKGEISAEELEALTSSGELEELQAVLEATDQSKLPAYDSATAYQQFRTKYPVETAKVRRLPVRWIIGVAASILLMVVALFLMQENVATIEAKNETNQDFQFADGSNVVLNDGTTLSYDKRSWSEKRVVELVGEAFFQVEKGVPFIVNTANGSIRVLGTAFNVRTRGGRLLVECYEGSVLVKHGRDSVVLAPQQSVKVADGNMNEVQTISHQQPFWSNGTSRFEEEPVNEVFDEIERQFGVEILDPPLNKTFSGAFSHNDLESAVRTVCKVLSLDCEVKPTEKKVLVNLEN